MADKKKRNHPRKSRIELSKEFSESPSDALVTSAQFAAWMGISEAKLERDRWLGDGCPFLKIGDKAVRYVKHIAVEYAEGTRTQGA